MYLHPYYIPRNRSMMRIVSTAECCSTVKRYYSNIARFLKASVAIREFRFHEVNNY